jgi:hypothetical protein
MSKPTDYKTEYKAEFKLPKPFTLHSKKWTVRLSLEDYLKLGGQIDQNTVAQLVDGLSAAETMEDGQVTSEQTRYIENLERVVERDLAGKFQDRFNFQIYNATAGQRFEAFCAARRILPPT